MYKSTVFSEDENDPSLNKDQCPYSEAGVRVQPRTCTWMEARSASGLWKGREAEVPGELWRWIWTGELRDQEIGRILPLATGMSGPGMKWCWMWCRGAPPLHCRWECKWKIHYFPLWRNTEYPQKLKIKLQCDSAISCWGMYPKEMKLGCLKTCLHSQVDCSIKTKHG